MKYNQGSWRKEKKTNKTNNTSLGLTQSARQEAFLVCICRLTLAWISSETSTKLLGMPTNPDRSSSLLWTLSHANSSLCCPVSTALSVVNCLLLSPFVSLSDWRSLPTSGHVEISSPNPLSGFAPKQIKGSSAWQTTYIVLQLFTSHHKSQQLPLTSRLSSMYKDHSIKKVNFAILQSTL